MTTREIKLARSLLNVLHDRDGHAANETDLFGEMTVRCDCTLGEFKVTLLNCDARGWLTGVKGKFAGKLWDINDEGEIARMQLSRE